MRGKFEDLIDLLWEKTRVRTFLNNGQVIPKANDYLCHPLLVGAFNRAWKRVHIPSLKDDVCWTHHGANASGRGQVMVGSGDNIGRLIGVPRLAYALLVKPVPVCREGRASNGLLPLSHTCKDRRCCRPSHLRFGYKPKAPPKPRTYRRGKESITNAKLTDSQVAQIREFRMKGYSAERIFKYQQELLRGVPLLAETTIRNAVNGSSFKHVPMPEYLVLPCRALTSGGHNNPLAKMDARKVATIRGVMAHIKKLRKHNYKIIGARFGMHPNSIASICKGQSWRQQ